MKHLMPELPYAMDALVPAMSKETLDFHYGKHLRTYIDNLNKLIAGTLYEDMELEELVCKSSGSVYNNAAQAWNHTFFFNSLTAAFQPMSARLVACIQKEFVSVADFQRQLTEAAVGHFGSGWAWLVQDSDGSLSVRTTQNADCPLSTGLRPILTIDVWEHAYYIDYRNRRADYVNNLWKIIDWGKVEQRMD